ncbi:hypothetical protein ACIBM3_31010 [Rhodococcus erythropolis]|uniref:hypothetical protein n=1 Tax=Rhodococcus erythropolis TaxID=1833 RepID=UPI0037BCA91F
MTERTTPTAGANSTNALRDNLTARISLSSLPPLGEHMMWSLGGEAEARSDG